MKAIWSYKSLRFYDLILEQLIERWNIKIVNDFEFDVFKLIHLIEDYNHICPNSKIIGYYKCAINKHTSKVYKIENNKDFYSHFYTINHNISID